MMVKKIIIAILFFSISFMFAGCWGKSELNEIGIITAIGIDAEPEGHIRVTVISIEPTGMPMDRTEKPNAIILTAVGNNFMEAAANLFSKSSKRLTWYHSRLILIGEDIARLGLGKVIDSISRFREIRYNNKVIITEGRAEDVLQMPSDIEGNLPVHIEGIIQNTGEWSKSFVTDLKSILITLTDKNKGFVTGKLGITETARRIVSTNITEYLKEASEGRMVKIHTLSGGAAFKNDRLAGFMDETETRGYLWITGKSESTAVTVKSPNGAGTVGFLINSVKNKISVNTTGNKIAITVKLIAEGNKLESTGNESIFELKTIKKIEKLVSEEMKGEMKAIVTKAQKEFKSDIFDFGGTIYRNYPKIWRNIEKDWGTIFPEVRVDYEVKAIVRRVGELYNPVILNNEAKAPGAK